MDRELLQIVKETKLLIKELYQKNEPSFLERPFSLPKMEKESPQIVLEPVAVTLKKVTSSLDDMKLTFQKVHPQIYREDESCFFYLITNEERDLPFLKKLSHAISAEIVPSKVCLVKGSHELKSLFNKNTIKLVIAKPSTLNEKGLSHKLTQFKNTPWLPLDKTEIYIKDSLQKRTLWKTLQTLPLADLLQ